MLKAAIARWRELVASVRWRDTTRLLIGLTFLGLVLSVYCWHLWLEGKAGIWVWGICLTFTALCGFGVSDTNLVLTLLSFTGSMICAGRTYQWLRGEMAWYVPFLWAAATGITIVVGKERRGVVVGALGIWLLLSLKAIVFDREPRAIYLAVAALALIAVMLRPQRHVGKNGEPEAPTSR